MYKFYTLFISVFFLSYSCFTQSDNVKALEFYTAGMENYNATNYELAIADFTKAIEENEKFVEAYFQRGCAKHYSDNYNGAVDDFSLAIDLRPDSEIFYKHFQIFLPFLQGDQ